MYDWIYSLLSDPSVLTLLTGVGAVLSAFLAMHWTAWGQENPVAKCVILSVMAHVVLLAYAYSLNLATAVPQFSEPLVVPIRVADLYQPESRPEEKDPLQRPLWEQIPTTELDPEIPALDSALVSTEVPLERETMSFDSLDSLVERLENDLQASRTTEASEVVPANSQWLDSEMRPADLSEAWNVTPKTFSASEQPQVEISQQANPPESDQQAGLDLMQELLADAAVAKDLERLDTTTSAEMTEQQQANSQPPQQTESQVEQPPIEAIADDRQWDRAIEMVDAIPLRIDQPPTEIFDPRPMNSPWVEPRRTTAQSEFMAHARQQAVAIRPGDQQPLPEAYRLRLNRQMEEVEQRGGSVDTEQAVARGLAFLVALQKPDGSWNPRETGGGREQQILGHNRQGAGAQADTGITALALLALMADGNTHLAGPYQETVRRGLEYLLQRQQRGGSLAGSAQYYAQMYCHSMALLALSEAYALTGDQRLRAAVIAGATYSQDTQNRAGGGWRYQPQEAGDMSQFGWQVMALSGAAINGISLDDPARRLMDQFLKRHARGIHGGLAIYRIGEPTSPTMTAEAMFCRYLLNQPPQRLMAEEATAEILGLVPGTDWHAPEFRLAVSDCRHLPGRQIDNLYFWYYANLSLRQMMSDPNLQESTLLPQAWDVWNRQVTARILTLQRNDGPMSGSWDPEACLWGGYGGRIYTTSLAVLCLQVYYRYDLPVTAPDRTALAPWSTIPITPSPTNPRSDASGNIRDWR